MSHEKKPQADSPESEERSSMEPLASITTWTSCCIRRLEGLRCINSFPSPNVSGWNMGLRIMSGVMMIILLANFTLTLIARLMFPYKDTESTIINGSCERTEAWGSWLHLLVNIMSTALLSASSYTMQCLVSPTREEVDKAHKKACYLDIGLPSLRNLYSIDRKRLSLWAVLALSSIPIHLLFNSAIYETRSTNSYILAVVTEDFVQGKPLSESDDISSYYRAPFPLTTNPNLSYLRVLNISRESIDWEPPVEMNLGSFTSQTFDELQEMVPIMQKLDNAECMKAYSQPLNPDRRNVFAVTPQNGDYTSTMYSIYYQSIDACPECRNYLHYVDTTLWICNSIMSEEPFNCNVNEALEKATNWTILNFQISYCLSEAYKANCQLKVNLIMLIVIILCNAVKIIIVITALLNLPKDILATIGDAAASFLCYSEPSTSRSSLLSKSDVISKDETSPHHPKRWSTASLCQVWGAAPSSLRWLTSVTIFLVIWTTAFALFTSSLKRREEQSLPIDLGTLRRMGFGQINQNTLLHLSDMSSASNTFAHVILVNTPQLILSLSYFAYNAIWSSMLQAAEWAAYGNKRRALLVTDPRGQQRSKYFLSIPYQYAIPLQIASSLLHWLLSQSFFLARVQVYPALPSENIPPSTINTIGYSLVPLIYFMALSGLMIVVVLCFACRPLWSPIPLVGGCSLAISAACHPRPSESGEVIAREKLQWGIVSKRPEIGLGQGSSSRIDEEGSPPPLLHCSLSAKKVISPKKLTVDPTARGWSPFKRTREMFA